MALTDDVKDLYDEGRISTRQMIRVQFGSGVYGFIARREPLVYAGVTYQPFGLLEVSASAAELARLRTAASL
ncbi:hypothetical protein AJ87_05825 [Rhizobium yanglingense]|nr:hypothetical protein AJ87_05825 [Rhizobium yanglingense]